jgi:hypothetical protein
MEGNRVKLGWCISYCSFVACGAGGGGCFCMSLVATSSTHS